MKPQPPLPIQAASARIWPLEEDAHGPADLRPEVQAAWGRPFRRVNHFIELALVGARSCLAGVAQAVPRECDILLATEQGNVADVARITEALVGRDEPPMPLDFINVPNNMAGFYLAQGLDLEGRNLTLSHRSFAFEAALDLAHFAAAVSPPPGPLALVGGVDACAFPLADHRQRMGLPARTPLPEGSSWLYTGGDPHQALAQCDWVRFSPDRAACLEHLRRMELPPDTLLARGYGLDQSALDEIGDLLSLVSQYEYHAEAPYHDTHCAWAVASFVTRAPARRLLHINTDPKGRYATVSVSLQEGHRTVRSPGSGTGS
jgi:hypothetical protein